MTDGKQESAPVAAALRIREIDMERPWIWLAAGWGDIRRAPAVSLSYGLIFSVVGFAVSYWLYSKNILYLIMPLAAGFGLVGPAAAVGLYDISRRLEVGRPVSLGGLIPAILSRSETLAAMGLVLMLFLMAWMEIALLIFAFFFGQKPVSAQNFVEQVFFSPESLPFVVVGTLAGAILAAAVFTISAVSLPMMLDRNISVPTAVSTSLRVVNENRKAMALWAMLIVVFTSFGIATLFAGLVVTLPLIGHATWHAYRDLVIWDDAELGAAGTVQ